MRHRNAGRKLGRTSKHRQATVRGIVTGLLLHERIITTVERAKECRRLAEHLITLAKEPTVHHIRQATSALLDKGVVRKLFKELGPRYKARPGGYTRILKLGGCRWTDGTSAARAGQYAANRLGDNGSRAIFELVDRVEKKEDAGDGAKKAAKAKKAAAGVKAKAAPAKS
ncbi:MAG: 50S ribosomal protein L17 [Planctomycetes bacterium]|nr:50S ribosomal protein L17 [Planctomycetota bacterium]